MSQRAYATLFGDLLADFDNFKSNIRLGLEACEQAILDLGESIHHADKTMEPIESNGILKLIDGFKQLVDAHQLNEIKKAIVQNMRSNLVAGRTVDGSAMDAVDLNDAETFMDRFANASENDPLNGVEKFSEHFTKKLKQAKVKYAKKSEEEKYETFPAYISMREKLWSINHSEPFSFDGVSAEQEEEDDELAIVGQATNYKCPLTAALMTEAWRSKACNHHFSSAIKLHIAAAQGKPAECPVSGCPKYVRLVDLERDRLFEKRAMRYEQEMEDEADRIAQSQDITQLD
ncbi:hypothetical protein HDU81_000520 [Chytriomyces hyalinus]|nr:hypothetical protein HDU81_000520 [Chytriomyces hyalinus]